MRLGCSLAGDLGRGADCCTPRLPAATAACGSWPPARLALASSIACVAGRRPNQMSSTVTTDDGERH